MIYVLLPAYNEENDIAALLKEFTETKLAYPLRLIIVDDGSTDGTANSILAYDTKLPLKLISHKINMGLGKALSTGFTYIASVIEDDDILVTMDANNSHKPKLINELTAKTYSGYDVVIASRFVKGAGERGVPLIRRILSFLASRLIKVIFPISNASDYTSGFRAFSASAVKRMVGRYGLGVVNEPGFSATLELLLKAKKIGIKLAEVPLILRYDEKTGKSKMKIMSTVCQYSKLLFKSIFSV